MGEVSGETAKALNLPDKQGVLVVHVESGSPAEKAGLEAGDIILKFNEQSIEKISELPRLVGDTPPGKTVRLSVWRKGKTLSLPVTVSVMQADVQSARVPQADREGGSMLSSKVLGLTVSDLTAAQKKQLGVKQGVLVTKAENPAVASGIRKGDVILRLNNADVANRNSFQDLVSKIDRKKRQSC